MVDGEWGNGILGKPAARFEDGYVIKLQISEERPTLP